MTESELRKIRKTVRKKPQKMYEDGRINEMERRLLSSDGKAAEKYGFEYGKEKLDG